MKKNNLKKDSYQILKRNTNNLIVITKLIVYFTLLFLINLFKKAKRKDIIIINSIHTNDMNGYGCH